MAEFAEPPARSVSMIDIFTSYKEVVAKVMFLQVCVCQQGGGCLPQCMLGCQTPQTRQTPLRPGRPPRPGRCPPDQADPPPDHADPLDRQTPPGPGRHPPDQMGGVCLSACWDARPPRTRQTPPQTRQTPRSRLQHTVYERPVRILLECILVS